VDRPAPLRPLRWIAHKRWWRTFNEYGNGIVGDMCVHMFDTVRWMLSSLRETHYFAGGHYVQTEGKSNITDTRRPRSNMMVSMPFGNIVPGVRRLILTTRGRFLSMAIREH